MKAKIATYDSNTGNGLLITKDNEKVDFSIDNWSDFDVLPEVGLLVSIDDNEKIIIEKEVSSNDVKHAKTDAIYIEELKKEKEKYINESTASGWIILSNNDSGFVLENQDSFSIGNFIILSLLLGLVFGLLFNIFGLLIAIVIAYILARPGVGTRLKGVANYEKLQIVITNKGKVYKVLKVTKQTNTSDKEEEIKFEEEAKRKENEKSKLNPYIVFLLFCLAIIGFKVLFT